jgi:hypothetical protein
LVAGHLNPDPVEHPKGYISRPNADCPDVKALVVVAEEMCQSQFASTLGIRYKWNVEPEVPVGQAHGINVPAHVGAIRFQALFQINLRLGARLRRDAEKHD